VKNLIIVLNNIQMKLIKNQFYETLYKSTTIPKGTRATLGTIEADASGYFGKHNTEEFRGKLILDKLIDVCSFKSFLDVGAGELKHTNYVKSFGKDVYTCDKGLKDGKHSYSGNYDFVGEFNDFEFNRKFDVVFCSHILEHQLNPNLFLKKVLSTTEEDGYIVIIVPPRKPFVTGGHYSIWNAGLVIYNLIMAGNDCSDVMVKQYDYNIGVIAKKKSINIDTINLTHDQHDIERFLTKYFPSKLNITEPFNGDIIEYNFDEVVKI